MSRPTVHPLSQRCQQHSLQTGGIAPDWAAITGLRSLSQGGALLLPALQPKQLQVHQCTATDFPSDCREYGKTLKEDQVGGYWSDMCA